MTTRARFETRQHLLLLITDEKERNDEWKMIHEIINEC